MLEKQGTNLAWIIATERERKKEQGSWKKVESESCRFDNFIDKNACSFFLTGTPCSESSSNTTGGKGHPPHPLQIQWFLSKI